VFVHMIPCSIRGERAICTYIYICMLVPLIVCELHNELSFLAVSYSASDYKYSIIKKQFQ
jgi:hypothetical protein